MAETRPRLVDIWMDRALRRRFGEVKAASAARLRQQRRMARFAQERLQRYLDRVEAGLTVSPKDSAGLALWQMRCAPWEQPLPAGGATHPGQDLIEGVSWHHDCPHSQVILRQEPQPVTGSPARFALRFEVFAFSGSYLSISARLTKPIDPDCVLQVDAPILSTGVGQGYIRINRQTGANVARQTVGFEYPDRSPVLIDPAELPEVNGDTWLDLIVHPKPMSTLTVADFAISALPRPIL